MDALKKAEAAKRQAAEGNATAKERPATVVSSGLSLEPIAIPAGLQRTANLSPNGSATNGDSQTALGQQLPELLMHLEDLDKEFVAHHTQYGERGTSPKKPTESPSPKQAVSAPQATSRTVETAAGAQAKRDAVRNVFEAKGSAPSANNRTFAIATGAIALFGTLGIGGYFWWQLQPKSGSLPSQIVTHQASPPATPPVAAPAYPILSAQNSTGATTDTDVQPIVAGTAPVFPTAEVVPVQREIARKQTVERQAEPEADNAIRLIRITKSPLQVNPALTKGFELFNKGNFTAAKAEYQSVFRDEPQNIDALHGLAAIAVRESRWEEADHYYERALVADPKDSIALAALINLHGQNNPVAAESRLKAITAAEPESGDAQFALGNLYAGQQRWADAQQAYFKAYSADAGNPDILFNLAISLEHLNQNKLAQQYYARAIDAAKQHPAGFDPAKAAARQKALRP